MKARRVPDALLQLLPIPCTVQAVTYQASLAKVGEPLSTGYEQACVSKCFSLDVGDAYVQMKQTLWPPMEIW